MQKLMLKGPAIFFAGITLLSCLTNNSNPPAKAIEQLHLKRGQVITCGAPGKEFGTVVFDIRGNEKLKADFNTGIELLHSFEYDEAEKVFAAIIDESPKCAMAYWGVAMCSYHPLWEPPGDAELAKGEQAIGIANSIKDKSELETGYINAMEAYFKDWRHTAPLARAKHFSEAMEKLHLRFQADPEASIFYALSLDASADPSDKTFLNQKKAGDLLNNIYQKQPNHPGIIHYLIHTYDYPGLAILGLPAARRYSAVAPSSAHALHMPSHIFTRLGLWEECVNTNLRSIEAAKCYANSAGIKGHWDEELHSLDYLTYAYLQIGDNSAAEEQLKYLQTIHEVSPVNFKEAYTFAAIPSRIALENKQWQQAAAINLYPAQFPWFKFPWQESIVHFTRLLGAAHIGAISSAQAELDELRSLRDSLLLRKDLYKSNQVAIQLKAGEAWIRLATNNSKEALTLMKAAADMEDSTSKHPVTPGEVLPARELYADMSLQLQRYEEAFLAYKAVLQKSPNRFNSLYGAGFAAEKTGNYREALLNYKQLCSITKPGSNRPELKVARAYLKSHT